MPPIHKKIKDYGNFVLTRGNMLTPSGLETSLQSLAAAAFIAIISSDDVQMLTLGMRMNVEFLKWLFEKFHVAHVINNLSMYLRAGNKLVSFFMFTLPSVRHPNFCDMLKVGLISGVYGGMVMVL